MDKRLLNILRCPVTQKGLAVANKALLDRINDEIAAGGLRDNDGRPVSSVLSEALVTDDGRRMYRIDDGIPVLLEGESINIEQFD